MTSTPITDNPSSSPAAELRSRRPPSKGAILTSLALLTIAGVGAAIFLPSYRHSFILDDYKHFEFIAPLVAAPWQAYKVISPYWIGWYYRPVQHWLILIGRLLFGFEPLGYYWLMLGLHAAATCLVYGVARKLGVGRLGAIVAALVFAINARNADVLGWISSYSIASAAVFALLAVYLYLAYLERSGRSILLIGVVAASVLALLSREESIVLAALLLLVRVTCPGRPRPKRAEILAALFLAGVLAAYAVFQFDRPTWMVGPGRLSPRILAQDLANQGISRSLSVIVSRYTLVSLPPPLTNGVPATLFTSAVLALLVTAFVKGSRAVRLGLAWATLYLAVGYIALWGRNPEALPDRYLYLPLIGIAWALGAGLEGLLNRIRASQAWRYSIAAVIVLPFIATHAGRVGPIYQPWLNDARVTQSLADQMQKLAPHPSPDSHFFAYRLPGITDYIQAMASVWYGQPFRQPGGDFGRLKKAGEATAAWRLYDFDNGALYELMPELAEHKKTVFIWSNAPEAAIWQTDGASMPLDPASYALDIVAGPPGARRLAIQMNAVPPEQGWASLAYSVTPPAGSRLALGIARDSGGAAGEDGMAFRVRLEDASGAFSTLFEQFLEVAPPGMGGWNEIVLPMDPYWGQPVKLHLEVFAGANHAHDFGFWANPRFVIDDES